MFISLLILRLMTDIIYDCFTFRSGSRTYFRNNARNHHNFSIQAALIDESDVSLWWRIGDIALKVTNMKLARYSFEKVGKI